MISIESILNKVALEVFQEYKRLEKLPQTLSVKDLTDDPINFIRSNILGVSPFLYRNCQILIDEIAKKEEFKLFANNLNEGSFFIKTPRESSRLFFKEIIYSLFKSSFLQIYCQGHEFSEKSFSETVYKNFTELVKAVTQNKVEILEVSGLYGISLEKHQVINTPWGVVKNAPATDNGCYDLRNPKCTCFLLKKKEVPISFNKSEYSKEENDPASPQDLFQNNTPFQLAFALGTDSQTPIVPAFKWTRWIFPFIFDTAFFIPLQPAFPSLPKSIEPHLTSIETWSKVIANSNYEKIDVAIKRVVSSILYRADKRDALIDAVIAWENLVGTKGGTTFRISASLAKLIIKTEAEREPFYNHLKKIYETRSKLVHGEHVEAKKIGQDSSAAIKVAIEAVRESFSKGQDWLDLKSSVRSDKLLLY